MVPDNCQVTIFFSYYEVSGFKKSLFSKIDFFDFFRKNVSMMMCNIGPNLMFIP